MPNDLYRLAVSITTADGQVYRWGGDEPSAFNVPQGLSFSTSMPGLFKDCTLTLPRPIDVDFPDLNLYDTVQVYAPGGQVVWEGRVAQLPRQHGDDFSVQVGCIGWAAHLRDDPSLVGVYVDLDPSHWQGPTLNRQITTATLNQPQGDYTATAGPSGITFIGNATQSIANLSTAELMYLMPPGLGVSKMMYKGTEANTSNIEAATLFTDDNDALSSAATTSLTLDNTLRTATPASAERYGMLHAQANATHTPVATAPFNRLYSKIAVYADHGLTSRANGTDPDGFYVSDLVADVVSRGAPLLTYTTTGSSPSIESNTFVVPHAAYPAASTAEDMILDINKYALWEWGVGASRTFFYRAPNPDRLTWSARLSSGAKISLEGYDANNVFNGVLVQYTDPTGVTKMVGPPGALNVDATDSTLADTSSTNPVNAHGIPKRWGVLNVSQVTTQAGAIQIGAVWLVEHALPQRRGTLTLTGTCTHPTKGERPVYEIQAGDWVKIADRPGDDARRIIETSFSYDDSTITCSLDNTTFKLDSILERLGVGLIGVI